MCFRRADIKPAGIAINMAMTKEIAMDYSMFRLIVNFVLEKRKQVEQE